MNKLKYLLLIVLCCCTQVYSQEVTHQQDSIMQMQSLRNQTNELKQKVKENPQDETAWYNYTLSLQVFQILTPTEEIKKEYSEMLKGMKQYIPDTATYALVRNMNAKPRERDMSMNEIMNKWPDAILYYPQYLAVASGSGDEAKVKEICTKWYQSGEYPAALLNFAYNELVSTDRDALVFADVKSGMSPEWVLQYGKGMFQDKRVISTIFLYGPYMDVITKELGIPGYKSEDTQTMTFADKIKSRMDHIIKHTKRPVYVAVSMDKNVLDLFKGDLYTEGLLMKYSTKPYDNLAVMRRNFEDSYLLDYLRQSFCDKSYPYSKKAAFNFNYIPAFKSLLQFYKESEDQTHYDKLSRLLQSIVNTMQFSSEKVRQQYLKSIDFE